MYRPTSISDEVLRKFCLPGDDCLSRINVMYSHHGDLTQSYDDRLRTSIGEERYAHVHWGTVVCNRRVLLHIPHWKHPEGVEHNLAFEARWFWCLDQVRKGDGVEPVKPRIVNRVPAAVMTELLAELPGIEFVHLPHVSFWRHGNRGAKRMREPAPKGLAFFKFDGGSGLVVAPVPERKKAQDSTAEAAAS